MRVRKIRCTTVSAEPYRILHKIGEGGCGVIYLAEQVEPVKRQVALKVLKLGMDSKAVLARFELERHALALMDHPNIAKVFDAGTTSTGQPYVAMELVRGIKITEYCDLTRATIAERLDLFLQVCRAIQHAHYQGIIHRDIKPSNVLVTLHDGVPIAKIIDFSVAKAAQGPLSEHTAHTVFEHFVGTPAYVSPEQATIGLPIDTRSDLYSLGVLLYELLTGHTPLDANSLRRSESAELIRRIREHEAERPSKLLASMPPEALRQVAERRRSSGGKLIQELRGDLDWIVMRCLEKDRTRRYQTADEIIREIQRYLRHEPVSARAPSIAYRLSRLARRHRLLFAAGLACIAFTLSLFALAVTTTLQAQRIAAERDRAEQESRVADEVSKFMLNVFSTEDPYTGHGEEITASELLRRAGQSVRENLKQHPEVRARLLESIGRAFRNRGDLDNAAEYLQEAVRLREQSEPFDPVRLIDALSELGNTARLSGDYNRAHSLYDRASKLVRKHGLQGTATFAKLLLNRGRLDAETGRPADGIRHLTASIDLYRSLYGSESVQAADVLLELTRSFQWLDDFQAAEHAAREALSIYERRLPVTDPLRFSAMIRLSEVLRLQNRLDEAAQLLVEPIRQQERIFGKNDWHVADALDALADVRRAQGRIEEAVALKRQTVAIHSAAKGKEHAMTAYYRTSLGDLLCAASKYDEAEVELRQALDTLTRTLSADHQYIASAEYVLAIVMLKTKRPAEAELLLRASIQRLERADAPDWRVARSASALGEAMQMQGRTAEAKKYLVESYRVLNGNTAADVHTREAARMRLARFYPDLAVAVDIPERVEIAARKGARLPTRAHSPR